MTTTSAPVTFCIEHTSALRAALTAVLPHAASASAGLPMLEAVKFETRNGALILVASDRFTLAAYRVNVGSLVNHGADFDALVSVADIKHILSTFKVTKRDDPMIWLTLDGASLTLHTEAMRVSVQHLSLPFPAYRSLIVMSQGDQTAAVAYTPEYLARFAKAATDCDPIVIHPWVGPGGTLVTAGDYFVGLIMPHKNADHPTVLPTWLDGSHCVTTAA